MTRFRFASLPALAATILLAGHAQARADSTEIAAADAAPSSDIIVTAQHRAQSVQDVGIAMSVLNGAELTRRGVTNINQLQYQTPGLEAVPAFGSGQPQFRLRGVGFDDYASNNASPVGVYVDDVAKPFPIQTQGLLFDLDRVEVLRGPQGTLYGRNTTGGAINFVTNRPTSMTRAGLDIEYGRFDLTRIEGYVSGAVTDDFKVRVSGLTEQDGAFQHNRDTRQSLGDADRIGLRAQAEWTPAPALDVLVEGHYGRDQSDGNGLYLFEPLAPAGTAVLPADASRRVTGWGGSSLFASVAGIAPDAKPFRDNRTSGGHVTIGYDLGGVKLTSISAYERFRREEYNDWDASSYAYAGTYFNSRARTVSQEVRLASTGKGPLRWQVGGYYSDERLRDAFVSDFGDPAVGGYLALTSYLQKTQVVAGFGQAEYDVGPFTLIGGARVEHEKRALEDFSTATVPDFGFPVLGSDRLTRYTKWSGKLEAEYHLGSSALLYASASKGIKSGGFTAYNTVTPDQIDAFKPERLWAFEGGVKSKLLHDTLTLNAAGFYYDYHDQQVQSGIFTTVQSRLSGAVVFQGPIGKIVNVPKSHIYGGELELTWQPVPALQISQGISWKKGVFDRFLGLDIAASGAAGAPVYDDRSGQDEGFPHWDYTGSATYTASLSNYHLIFQTDYSYRSTLDPVLLGSLFKVHSYWLVNGTITLTPKDSWWQIGVYGRNIFNAHYDLTRNFFLPDIDIAAPGRPASYGVRLGFHI